MRHFILIITTFILFVSLAYWSDIRKVEYQTVTKVIDGDTIILDNGERIRYIGMDTPEISVPITPLECYGEEATEFNKNLVDGKEVKLIRDVKDEDKFGRKLRYVYVDDIFVNQKLVEEGYARHLEVYPNVSFSREFELSEEKARDAGVGIWDVNKCNGS